MSALLRVVALVAVGVAVFQLAWMSGDHQVRAVVRAWRSRVLASLRMPDARQRFDRGFGALGRLARDMVPGGPRARGSAREMRGRCLDELPELLDVVALGLSAGISFDAALDIYCERYHTMLAGRLSEAMRCWRLGIKSRRDALRDVADELGVDAFSTFAATMGESLEFGGPLAAALVEQGEAVRERRRSEQEESVEKAPVKMLIPVGTLTLPAMLIAILGPLFASFGAGP